MGYGVWGLLLQAIRPLDEEVPAAECEAAGMKISTFKAEAMVLNQKWMHCRLLVGDELPPQAKELKYLGVLFTSEGRREREIDRRTGAALAEMLYGSSVVKREQTLKAKLWIYRLIFVPTLTYALGSDRKNEITEKRGRNEFPSQVSGLSLRDGVRSSDNRKGLKVKPLLLRIKRSQLRWFGHLSRMPPGRLPGEVFQACPTRRRPQGRPRTHWLAEERLGIPPEELEEVAGEREVWASPLRLQPPQNPPDSLQ
nr:uncharacterized protein LOC111837982 [Paramormyrops kingsleyae]